MTKIYVSSSAWDYEARNFVDYVRRSPHARGLEIEAPQFESRFDHNPLNSFPSLVRTCDLFLCFTDQSRPEVMLELGYAMGANKEVILAGDVSSIPSNLMNNPFIRRGTEPADIVEFLAKYRFAKVDVADHVQELLDRPSEIVHTMMNHPELVDSIDAKVFEGIVARWFEEKGLRVEGGAEGPDGGYDFSVSPFRGGRALVEVKKYKSSSQVPVSAVRQLAGSLSFSRAEYGILISSAHFTEAAKFFANGVRSPILLWTLDDLDRMRKSIV